MGAATSMRLWCMSASELAVRSQQVSSREAVEGHLRRIEEANPATNAVTVVLAEEAMQAADAAGEVAVHGAELRRLHGAPFTIKANIDLADPRTTAGLRALAYACSAEDAPQVARMRAVGPPAAIQQRRSLAQAIMRHLLRLPVTPIRSDLAPHPEVWADLCGWYDLAPGAMTNLFMRLVMGAGAEVRVKNRQLLLQPLTPIPALRRGMRLYPDDPDDPYVFRIDMSDMGKPSLPVAFTPAADGSGMAQRFCFGESVFHRRPDALNPRLVTTAALAVGGTAAAIGAAARRTGSHHEATPLDNHGL